MKRTLTLLSFLLLVIVLPAKAQWTAMGSGLNGRVRSLVVFNNQVYAGGTFTGHVAVWNGSAWSTAGDGLGTAATDSVNALCVHAGVLYAGGVFTATGTGTTVKYIAKLNTSTNKWEQVGTQINNFVRGLYSDGTDLYAGGAFTTPSSTVSRIAKLSGSTWVQVGDPSNLTGVVNNIVKFNGSLYIGGSFAGLVAKLNGSVWSTISGVTGTEVNALAVFGNRIYIGGNFNQYLVTYNGTSVGSAFNTINARVWALLGLPTRIFGGGSFTSSPSTGASLPHFFLYDGASPFTALGSGFNGDVYAFTNFNGKIVAGGGFSTAGGVSATNVAISGTTIDVPETDAVVAHSFYPNPMIDRSVFELETREMLLQPAITIYDAAGREVRSADAALEINGNRLRLVILRDELNSGFYLLSVSDNGRPVFAERFLVK
jgi:hypothetical protein